MHLQIRLPYDPSLALALKAKKAHVRYTDRDVFVDLPRDDGRVDGIPQGAIRFQIPREAAEGELQIVAHEQRFGGKATVVCELSGATRRPIGAGKQHDAHFATFIRRDAIVTVEASYPEKGYKVILHRADRKGGYAYIESQVLCRGVDVDDLKYVQYREAVKAAMVKADCEECQCLHYVAERQLVKATEPVPALQKAEEPARAPKPEKELVAVASAKKPVASIEETEPTKAVLKGTDHGWERTLDDEDVQELLRGLHRRDAQNSPKMGSGKKNRSRKEAERV